MSAAAEGRRRVRRAGVGRRWTTVVGGLRPDGWMDQWVDTFLVRELWLFGGGRVRLLGGRHVTMKLGRRRRVSRFTCQLRA